MDPSIAFDPWRYMPVHQHIILICLLGGVCFAAFMWLFICAMIAITKRFATDKINARIVEITLLQHVFIVAAMALAFGASMAGSMVLMDSSMGRRVMDMDEVIFVSTLFLAGMIGMAGMLAVPLYGLRKRLNTLLPNQPQSPSV